MKLEEVMKLGKPFTHPDIGYCLVVFQNHFYVHDISERREPPKPAMLLASSVTRTDWNVVETCKDGAWHQATVTFEWEPKVEDVPVKAKTKLTKKQK